MGRFGLFAVGLFDSLYDKPLISMMIFRADAGRLPKREITKIHLLLRAAEEAPAFGCSQSEPQ
jgi:hypothetical protein